MDITIKNETVEVNGVRINNPLQKSIAYRTYNLLEYKDSNVLYLGRKKSMFVTFHLFLSPMSETMYALIEEGHFNAFLTNSSYNPNKFLFRKPEGENEIPNKIHYDFKKLNFFPVFYGNIGSPRLSYATIAAGDNMYRSVGYKFKVFPNIFNDSRTCYGSDAAYSKIYEDMLNTHKVRIELIGDNIIRKANLSNDKDGAPLIAELSMKAYLDSYSTLAFNNDLMEPFSLQIIEGLTRTSEIVNETYYELNPKTCSKISQIAHLLVRDGYSVFSNTYEPFVTITAESLQDYEHSLSEVIRMRHWSKEDSKGVVDLTNCSIELSKLINADPSSRAQFREEQLIGHISKEQALLKKFVLDLNTKYKYLIPHDNTNYKEGGLYENFEVFLDKYRKGIKSSKSNSGFTIHLFGRTKDPKNPELFANENRVSFKVGYYPKETFIGNHALNSSNGVFTHIGDEIWDLIKNNQQNIPKFLISNKSEGANTSHVTQDAFVVWKELKGNINVNNLNFSIVEYLDRTGKANQLVSYSRLKHLEHPFICTNHNFISFSGIVSAAYIDEVPLLGASFVVNLGFVYYAFVSHSFADFGAWYKLSKTGGESYEEEEDPIASLDTYLGKRVTDPLMVFNLTQRMIEDFEHVSTEMVGKRLSGNGDLESFYNKLFLSLKSIFTCSNFEIQPTNKIKVLKEIARKLIKSYPGISANYDVIKLHASYSHLGEYFSSTIHKYVSHEYIGNESFLFPVDFDVMSLLSYEYKNPTSKLRNKGIPFTSFKITRPYLEVTYDTKCLESSPTKFDFVMRTLMTILNYSKMSKGELTLPNKKAYDFVCAYIHAISESLNYKSFVKRVENCYEAATIVSSTSMIVSQWKLIGKINKNFLAKRHYKGEFYKIGNYFNFSINTTNNPEVFSDLIAYNEGTESECNFYGIPNDTDRNRISVHHRTFYRAYLAVASLFYNDADPNSFDFHFFTRYKDKILGLYYKNLKETACPIKHSPYLYAYDMRISLKESVSYNFITMFLSGTYYNAIKLEYKNLPLSEFRLAATQHGNSSFANQLFRNYILEIVKYLDRNVFNSHIFPDLELDEFYDLYKETINTLEVCENFLSFSSRQLDFESLLSYFRGLNLLTDEWFEALSDGVDFDGPDFAQLNDFIENIAFVYSNRYEGIEEEEFPSMVTFLRKHLKLVKANKSFSIVENQLLVMALNANPHISGIAELKNTAETLCRVKTLPISTFLRMPELTYNGRSFSVAYIKRVYEILLEKENRNAKEHDLLSKLEFLFNRVTVTNGDWIVPFVHCFNACVIYQLELLSIEATKDLSYTTKLNTILRFLDYSECVLQTSNNTIIFEIVKDLIYDTSIRVKGYCEDSVFGLSSLSIKVKEEVLESILVRLHVGITSGGKVVTDAARITSENTYKMLDYFAKRKETFYNSAEYRSIIFANACLHLNFNQVLARDLDNIVLPIFRFKSYWEFSRFHKDKLITWISLKLLTSILPINKVDRTDEHDLIFNYLNRHAFSVRSSSLNEHEELELDILVPILSSDPISSCDFYCLGMTEPFLPNTSMSLKDFIANSFGEEKAVELIKRMEFLYLKHETDVLVSANSNVLTLFSSVNVNDKILTSLWLTLSEIVSDKSNIELFGFRFLFTYFAMSNTISREQYLLFLQQSAFLLGNFIQDPLDLHSKSFEEIENECWDIMFELAKGYVELSPDLLERVQNILTFKDFPPIYFPNPTSPLFGENDVNVRDVLERYRSLTEGIRVTVNLPNVDETNGEPSLTPVLEEEHELQNLTETTTRRNIDDIPIVFPANAINRGDVFDTGQGNEDEWLTARDDEWFENFADNPPPVPPPYEDGQQQEGTRRTAF